MTIASLLLIYFCIYCIAVIHAYLRARTGHAPKARNAAAAMCIGAAGSLLIYVLSLLEPAGSVPLVLVAVIALCPIFLLGLGCLVGLGIAAWRPRPLVQIALGVLALGLPLLAILTIDATPAQSAAARQQEAQQVATEFQRQTINGRLGRYPITLPTSPQLATSYSCFADGGAEIGQCHADFATATELSNVPGDVPIFHNILVSRKASECAAPCLSFRRIAMWCQGRRDVTFAEWCRRDPGEKIVFSYDENRAPFENASNGWRLISGPFGKAQVACLDREPDMTCRARYDIARNLEVTIWMDAVQVGEDTLAPRLSAAQGYVARLWSTLQSGPNQTKQF